MTDSIKNKIQSELKLELNFSIENQNNYNFKKEMRSLSQNFKQINNKKFKLNNCKLMNLFYIIVDTISGLLIKKSYDKSKQIDRLQNKELYLTNYDDKEIEEDEYIELRMLSNKGINSTFLIYHIEQEALLVLKVFNSIDGEKLFEREHLNYLKIHHPFLPIYYGTTKYYSNDSIIIEYIYGNTLSMIESMEIDEIKKIKIIFQILIGIDYFHQNEFIYRDLKPNNIILNDQGLICIIDLDRMINNGSSADSTIDFAHNYIAPEIIDEGRSNNKIITSKADIYSIGEIIRFIFKKELETNNLPEYYYLNRIIRTCLNRDESKRPNISELIDDFMINIFSNLFEINDKNRVIHIINIYYLYKKRDFGTNMQQIQFVDNQIDGNKGSSNVKTNHDIEISQKKIIKSFYILYFYANRNIAEAQYSIGKYFLDGKIVTRDINKAIQYLTLSANQNNANAQYLLGETYFNGKYASRDINKTIHYLTLSANQNNANAQYLIGKIYFDGEIISRNINKSIQYLTLSANQNNANAQYLLGEIYFNGKYDSRDINKTIHYLTLSANQNNADAQYLIGKIYFDGEIISRNINKSIHYLTLSANQNNVDAQLLIGEIYFYGKYVSKDMRKAIYYFTLSANQNNSRAQLYLGVFYFDGYQSDINKAIHYLTLSANQNDEIAQWMLGNIYFKRDFSLFDINKSIYYLTLSADRNNADAQFKLGKIYLDGKYIHRNINKSIHYLTLSANQNNPDAQYFIGLIYYKGIHISQDINKSIYYFTLSANQNNSDAQYYLGNIYLKEKSIPKDINKAIHYLNLSANNNNVDAQNVLGLFYIDGENIPHDIDKSIHYFTLSSNQNNDYAQYVLGLIYYKGTYVARDIYKSIHYFTLSANQNNADAQLFLGYIYYYEKLITKDIKKAIYYLSLSANQNNSKANYILGLIYFLGEYISKDINKSIHHFTLSANQNNSYSQLYLGFLYYTGKFIPRDIKKSISYFLLSANQNNADAQYYLGKFYYEGKYVQQNINKSIYYLTISADNLCIDANYYLGCIYLKGEYIERNIEKAIHHFKECSSFNNQFAKNNLGIIFRNIKKNGIFIEYFEEAIRQKNDMLSLLNLSLSYLYGKMINVDIDKSIDFLIQLSKIESDLSPIFLGIAIDKKMSELNLTNISKELEKYENIDKELHEKIINSIQMPKTVIECYYLINEYADFGFLYDLDRNPILYSEFMNNKTMKSIDSKDEEKRKSHIQKLFYDGFGLNLL